MNIILCIKQVPASNNVKIDPISGTLIRDGSNVKMNPDDLFAIEASLLIKEKCDAKVTSITMGPPSSMDVLYESLAMGVDNAVLLSDRKFGGADVVATSYTLCEGIKALKDYSLIICGKQTTDGDTGQVGAEIAEYLNIPHISYVTEVIEIKEKSIILKVNNEENIEIVEVDLPCLITIEKDAMTPRLPSYKRSALFKDYKVKVISFNDVEDKDENHYGLKGSATKVEKMFNPEPKKERTFINGSEEEITSSIVNILKENKVL